jgi:hypothetical protein
MKRISILSALLAGCSATPAPQTTATQSISIGPELDILFVIDNSASTEDKQTLLALSIPRLVQTLDAFSTGRPDLHIGVVTTTIDQGAGAAALASNCPSPNPLDDGRLRRMPGAAAPPGCSVPSDPYISDVAQPDGTRLTNYTGMLQDTLACLAQLGEGGCGFEAPLEAMKRALDGTHPENAGFLRPGAALAVVILTDEDDASVEDQTVWTLPPDQAGPGDFRVQPLHAYQCDTPISATDPGTYTNCVPGGSYLYDPQSYAQFLGSLDGPSEVVVAVLAGDPTSTIMTGAITNSGQTQSLAFEPSCMAAVNGNLAVARPAIRIKAFLDQLGSNGMFQSVCQSDFDTATHGIGTQAVGAMGSCLAPRFAGVDPTRCTVSELAPGAASVALPACDATGVMPCWSLDTTATCATRELHVDRATAAPTGTYDHVSCTQ